MLKARRTKSRGPNGIQLKVDALFSIVSLQLLRCSISKRQSQNLISGSSLASLRLLHLTSTSLTHIEASTLAQVVVNLEEVNLTRTDLTLTQLGAIFEAIVRGRSCLKRLDLSFVASWLGSLDPSLIGASLASLEEVVMEGVKLTKAQVCTKKKI